MNEYPVHITCACIQILHISYLIIIFKNISGPLNTAYNNEGHRLCSSANKTCEAIVLNMAVFSKGGMAVWPNISWLSLKYVNVQTWQERRIQWDGEEGCGTFLERAFGGWQFGITSWSGNRNNLPRLNEAQQTRHENKLWNFNVCTEAMQPESPTAPSIFQVILRDSQHASQLLHFI